MMNLSGEAVGGLASFYKTDALDILVVADDVNLPIVRLLETGREASEVMAHAERYDAELATAVAAAGRNDPCPCGSGLKVKRCHGETQATVPADLSRIPLGTPRPPVAHRPRADAGA
jgi:hypothetical protein